MADVDVTISTIDRATAELKQINSSLKELVGTQGKATEQSNKVAGGVSNASSALSGFNKALGAVGLPAIGWTAAIGGVVALAKNAISTTAKYTEEVRDLSFVTGTGAEKTSRLLQVLDDFQLGAQDVETATRAMTKNGLVPTVETLAKLSDQYLQINDAQGRNEFILKNLGKSGIQWVNFLNQGSDAILALNEGVNKNLILNDAEVERYERYRLAVDNIKDTFDGYKVAAVNGYLDITDAEQRHAQALDFVAKQQGKSTDELTRAMVRNPALVAQIDAQTREYMRLQQYGSAWEKALQSQGVVIQDTSENYAELIKSGLALTKANTVFSDTQEKIKKQYDDSNFVSEVYKQHLADLKDQYKDGEISAKTYYDSVNNLRTSFKDGSFAAQEQASALAELEAASDQQAQAFALNALEIAGATEKQKYDFAEASGLMTKQAADQARAQSKLAAAYTSGKLSAEEYAAAVNKINGDVKSLDGLKAEAYVDVFIKTHGSIPDWALPGKDSPSLNQDLSGLLAGGSTDVQPGVYEFNEAGAEGLVMRSDGSVAVVPHSEWENMKKYGIMPQAGYRSGTFGVGASGGLGSSASSAARNISARGGRLDASAVFSRGISEPSPQESQTEQDKTTASKLATVIEKMNNQATQKNMLPQTVALDKATIRELQKGIAKEVANLVG